MRNYPVFARCYHWTNPVLVQVIGHLYRLWHLSRLTLQHFNCGIQTSLAFQQWSYTFHQFYPSKYRNKTLALPRLVSRQPKSLSMIEGRVSVQCALAPRPRLNIHRTNSKALHQWNHKSLASGAPGYEYERVPKSLVPKNGTHKLGMMWL